ncbi:MAG TPA: penicillin-binding transpeptidase domain-containing protein, partial [Pseudomonadales bacterium]
MIAHAIRQWRFWLAAIMLSGLFLVLLGRVAMLQLIDVDGTVTFLQGQGDARTLRTETVLANRGMITDRHGQPLAVSTPVKNIWVNPRELDFASPALKQLAKRTGYSERELRDRLALYRDKQFAYLRRHLSPADADRVLALNIRGVYAEEEYRRFYPAGETASHLIGFTGNEGKGLEGVELGFDNWLQGINGSNQVIKDLYGRTIKTVSEIQQASPGKDLALSIDLRIQHVAYRALKEAVVKHRAEAGSAVVLDVATGEVLAMVNQPSFNPNNRAVMDPGSVRNRAVTDVFEPGSTVKPLTVLAALESGRFTPDTVIDTSPGYIRLNGKTLLDPVNYQKLDVTG